MSSKMLGSFLNNRAIFYLHAFSNFSLSDLGIEYHNLALPQWLQLIEQSIRSSQCQQKVLYFMPIYNQGMLMPEISFDLGNYMRELCYLYKLLRFQGWSRYSFCLWSRIFWPSLPKPDPYFVVGRSAAYSTFIFSPTQLST